MTTGAGTTGWMSDPQEVCLLGATQFELSPNGGGYYNKTNYNFRNWYGIAVINSGGSFPNYSCDVYWESQPKNPPNSPWNPQSITNWGMENRDALGGCKVYVSAAVSPLVQGSACLVGDPINPANAAVCHIEADAKNAGPLAFKRFYNSADATAGTLGPGWRHSFSRSIKKKHSGSSFRPYSLAALDSSLYNSETEACINGFAEIKPKISTWASASASYSGGLCTVAVGSTGIANLPLYYTSPPTPVPGSTALIGLDATRDDGQLVSFTVQGGVVKTPPSMAMKLQQVAGGYTLTDAEDNVESYDTNGRLLSITSRSGVVQTMSYDAGGRLSTVTDSFGHKLILGYDSQSRLSTVTNQ